MRYIEVQPDVSILDALTDLPTGEECSFAETIRAITTISSVSAAHEGALGILDLSDIRSLFNAAKPGVVVAVPDNWWKELALHDRLPGISVSKALSIAPHIRAIKNAATEPPKES